MSVFRPDLIGCPTFRLSNECFPPRFYRVFYFPPHWRDYKSPRHSQRAIPPNQTSQTQEHISSLAPGPNVPRTPYPFPNNEQPPFIRRARLPFRKHQDINITSAKRWPLGQQPPDSTSRLNTDLLGSPSRLRQNSQHEPISQTEMPLVQPIRITLADAMPPTQNTVMHPGHYTELTDSAITYDMNPNKLTVTSELGTSTTYVLTTAILLDRAQLPHTTLQLSDKSRGWPRMAHSTINIARSRNNPHSNLVSPHDQHSGTISNNKNTHTY